MAPEDKLNHPDGVIEHDGLLWKPKEGATSSVEEFLAARALFIELHDDADWNPWVLNDRAKDLERAQQIMGEWTRAEPGHRPMTKKQIDAMMARQDSEFKARQAADRERCDRDRLRYDPEREHARLSLLEHQSRMEFELHETAGLRDGTRFPAMDPRRRAEQVAEHDRTIAQLRSEIERLTNLVGDPEDVVDAHGRLPKDRREITLFYYRLNRQSEVEELRAKLPEIDAALKAATSRDERSKLQIKLGLARQKLEKLLAVPPLASEDMCADCPAPFSSHGWSTPPWDGPCPAWPSWAARLKEARKILYSASAPKQPVAPSKPKAEPLAVIPSGLPISEVLERLKELQDQYPDAEVRRGRANRWELWPGSSTSFGA
ncbi:hypothetical protein [Nonomuraea insulae]|uniref:Uncharacterized protein n=1 Tax=Nonomuraea insulae TaxID=1616787 RepID=A0ABW1CTH2_9ACTN